MIHTYRAPRSFTELSELLQRATQGADSVAMHAGHFLLFHDAVDDKVVPCIASELPERQAATSARFGMFPELSWSVGLRLLAALPAPKKHLVVVANDWQYVPPTADRATFFRDWSSLPAAYARELAKYPDISLLAPPARNGTSHVFFSEMMLRNRFRKRMRRFVKNGTLPADATILREGTRLSCRLPDAAGGQREIYCSEHSADCAGEIAELIDEVVTGTGCQAFINLYPRVCRDFVEYGTQLAPRVFNTDIRACVNVGLTSTDVHDEASLLSGCECVFHGE